MQRTDFRGMAFSIARTPGRHGEPWSPVDTEGLERRPYDRRPRYQYVLTDKGTELLDILMVMVGSAGRGAAP
jgi:hypothetical protein